MPERLCLQRHMTISFGRMVQLATSWRRMVSFTGSKWFHLSSLCNPISADKKSDRSRSYRYFSSQLIWRCGQSDPELCWSSRFRCRTRNQFHEVVVQCDTRFSIEHGSANFAVEVGRNNVVFGVTQNAFHSAFRSGFDGFLDFFVGRCFSRRTVRSTTDTFESERGTPYRSFAVQFWQYFTYCFSSAGRGRDDVLSCAAPPRQSL